MNIILNLMYYYVGTSIFLSIQAIGDEVMESLLTERKESSSSLGQDQKVYYKKKKKKTY